MFKYVQPFSVLGLTSHSQRSSTARVSTAQIDVWSAGRKRLAMLTSPPRLTSSPPLISECSLYTWEVGFNKDAREVLYTLKNTSMIEVHIYTLLAVG